jgi:hypothetical protein
MSPDMFNPQKGMDLFNNNSIISRIYFTVTIFQQIQHLSLGHYPFNEFIVDQSIFGKIDEFRKLLGFAFFLWIIGFQGE